MATKRDEEKNEAMPRDQVGTSRRDFFKAGAAAGVGAAVLSVPAKTLAQAADDIQWDYEADVVVCGGGASGLICAIRARDAGASVLVIEAEFRCRRKDAA